MWVGTELHGNDATMVFFIHPHESRLCVVVEDTSAAGPGPRGARSSEHAPCGGYGKEKSYRRSMDINNIDVMRI